MAWIMKKVNRMKPIWVLSDRNTREYVPKSCGRSTSTTLSPLLHINSWCEMILWRIQLQKCNSLVMHLKMTGKKRATRGKPTFGHRLSQLWGVAFFRALENCFLCTELFEEVCEKLNSQKCQAPTVDFMKEGGFEVKCKSWWHVSFSERQREEKQFWKSCFFRVILPRGKLQY